MGLRIMWSSNAPWCHTGYGVQAKYLLPRLARLGHEPACFAWYGLDGAQFTITLDGVEVPIYPRNHDIFGRDVIKAHCDDWKADVLITLMDIWVLPENFQERVGVVWAPWFPIDHEPIPPPVLAVAKRAAFPITYSHFGQRMMTDAGVKSWYIPHGVDTSIFCPGDKLEARRTIGLPEDAFICCMVAANKGYPSRKAFSENIEAFAQFRATHPDAVLYLHTTLNKTRDGLDLVELCKALELPPDCLFKVPQYAFLCKGLADSYMAEVYRAADVHLGAARNEGFGIPILEAQACGTPVITLDTTSMTELTWNGVCVPPVQRTWTVLNSFVGVVPVAGVREALEEIYNWTAEERAQYSEAGVARARTYDWDVLAADYWAPLLEEIEECVGKSASKSESAEAEPVPACA